MWLLVSPVRADDAYATATLELVAPAECIGQPALTARVAEQLGRPPFVTASEAELVVVVRVEPSDDGYYAARLELRLRESGEVLGTRGLSSDQRDCASLDDPLAVIVAMLLNVQRDELALPAPRSPWEARISLRGGLGLGLLPGPAVEAELEVGATLRRMVSLALAVGYGWADAVPAAEGRLFVHGGALRLVVAPILVSDDVVELSLPLAVGLGVARGEAAGFAANRGQTLLYFDVGAGLRIGLLVAPFLAIELGGDLRAVPIPPAFTVRDPDGAVTPLFTSLFVAGSLHGGLSFRLP